jgi:AraC-like DNA-binding protein
VKTAGKLQVYMAPLLFFFAGAEAVVRCMVDLHVALDTHLLELVDIRLPLGVVVDVLVAGDKPRRRNAEFADATSLRLLLCDLRATLAKFRSRLGSVMHGESNASPIELELQRIALEPDSGLPLLFDRLRTAYEYHCSVADEHRASRSRKLVQAVEEHIEEHFAEPNLGVPSIAEAFAISETYLSQAFKEHSGETVYRRIEQRRLEHARNLLGETSLPIRVVAEMAGYNSSNTFCKVFKRAVGVSATSFRKDARTRTV